MVELSYTLTVSYELPTSMVLLRIWCIDVSLYAKVGLTYILANLHFLRFKKSTDTIHIVKRDSSNGWIESTNLSPLQVN